MKFLAPVRFGGAEHTVIQIAERAETDHRTCGSPVQHAIHEDLPNPRAAHRKLTLGTTTLPQLHARQSSHQRAFLKIQDGFNKATARNGEHTDEDLTHGDKA